MCTGERTGPLLSAKRIPERVVASDPPEDGSRAAAPSATTRPIPAKAWGCASRYCRSAAFATDAPTGRSLLLTARTQLKTGGTGKAASTLAWFAVISPLIDGMPPSRKVPTFGKFA